MTDHTQYVIMVTAMMFGPIIFLCALYEIDKRKNK